MTDSEMARLIKLARQARKELKRLRWLWGEVIEGARKSKEEMEAMDIIKNSGVEGVSDGFGEG